MNARFATALLCLLGIAAVARLAIPQGRSEVVEVKYRGPVELKSFNCTDVNRSSLVKRVCYDRTHHYMVISLNGTYYHYCEIDEDTVEALKRAESMGRYYNASIKGRFDCRTHRVPNY
jgi:hypothetical protein